MKGVAAVWALAGLSVLMGACSNPWKDNYTSAGLGVFPRTETVRVTGMTLEEVVKSSGPDGAVRIGIADFVSSSDPSVGALQEFAREIGATTVEWGRGFVTVNNRTEYRTETWPRSLRGRERVRNADGTYTEREFRGTVEETETVPYSVTDTWYRYVAKFYREDEDTMGAGGYLPGKW